MVFAARTVLNVIYFKNSQDYNLQVLEVFYFAPPRRPQTIYYNNDFDCLQRNSSKTCFRALLVC